MKYFDIRTVCNSYIGFQDRMTNKSWGYLALLKGCKSVVKPSTPYEVDLNEVSTFLESIFNLSQKKKNYSGGRSLYVIFSNKWDRYFNDQGSFTPNIYDVIVWAYRKKAFPDNITNEELLKIFSEEFNISTKIIANSFDTRQKDITYNSESYLESELALELNRVGVNVSTKNIDAKKTSVVASPGEISRGPFVQTLYAGLDITDYVIILQSNYYSLFGETNTTTDSIENEPPLDATHYRPYITAIKSKPFLLLAGISGTGKSRIVRELARACWENGSEEYKAQKPRNFEMVQVKPNWHDSSELMGYVSRIGADKEGNGVVFVAGDFLKFIAKAWAEPDVPYFLCLDEMNLAPVEQYFAEYLSVIESRKADKNGVITTDPIIKRSNEKWYYPLVAELANDEETRKRFLEDGICIPQNLIVVGTVNMDETTFSFSRKVLDRAMTIEMNEVNLRGGLEDRDERIGKLGKNELVGTSVEGVDVYSANKDVCKSAIKYLESVNEELEGTPFKIAYRTRNEALLYVVNNLPYKKDKDENTLDENYVIARALDEITNMKILSRIEGDETKVGNLLEKLTTTIAEQLRDVAGKEFSSKKDESDKYYSVSLAKLKEMKDRLSSGYTSFWS